MRLARLGHRPRLQSRQDAVVNVSGARDLSLAKCLYHDNLPHNYDVEPRIWMRFAFKVSEDFQSVLLSAHSFQDHDANAILAYPLV